MKAALALMQMVQHKLLADVFSHQQVLLTCIQMFMVAALLGFATGHFCALRPAPVCSDSSSVQPPTLPSSTRLASSQEGSPSLHQLDSAACSPSASAACGDSVHVLQSFSSWQLRRLQGYSDTAEIDPGRLCVPHSTRCQLLQAWYTSS